MRIEELIKREYLERDEEKQNVYVCLHTAVLTGAQL